MHEAGVCQYSPPPLETQSEHLCVTLLPAQCEPLLIRMSLVRTELLSKEFFRAGREFSALIKSAIIMQNILDTLYKEVNLGRGHYPPPTMFLIKSLQSEGMGH